MRHLRVAANQGLLEGSKRVDMVTRAQGRCTEVLARTNSRSLPLVDGICNNSASKCSVS